MFSQLFLIYPFTLQTPLTNAAKNGDLLCVKLLLANKSDIYLKGHHNGKERFAWEIAQMHGHVKIAKYINACVGKSLAIQLVVW